MSGSEAVIGPLVFIATGPHAGHVQYEIRATNHPRGNRPLLGSMVLNLDEHAQLQRVFDAIHADDEIRLIVEEPDK